MRILYLAQYFNLPSEPGGGRAYQFARRWALRGHQVTVVTGALNYKTLQIPERLRGRLWTRERIEGFDVIRVWVYPHIRGSFRRRMVNFLSYAVTASLAGLMRAGRPDVVYATSTPLTVGLPARFLSTVRRAPLAFEVRDLWPESALVAGVLREGRLSRAAAAFARSVYRRARVVVALTRGIAEEVIATGVPAGRVLFAPNGIDDWVAALDFPAARREDLGLAGRFVCAYVGAHGIWNGLSTIVQAAERLRGDPRFAFVFVGDGDDKPNLVQFVREKGLTNVVFLDSVPKRAAMGYVAMADCCLIATWDHPFQRMVFPNKLFDYMGCGRPSVAAAEGETAAAICEAGAGLVVAPEKPAEMAAALVRLAAMPDSERAEMGARARRYALERFRRDDIADGLITKLERLVDRTEEAAARGQA